MTTQTTQPTTKARWVVDPVHSAIEFAAKHMMVATVRGRFPNFEVALDLDEARPENSRVEARIQAASIETKEAKRDAHLRSADFLEAEKHPVLTFKSRRIEPKGKGRYAVVGDLTIRGVTREVALDATYTDVVKDPWGGYRAGVTAETAINRKDFGLTWNLALEAGGLLVGDTVKISIELELVKQTAQ
ncbi:MAG: YceI family protein [Chloroflexi bacterium]|nr:YceI family protein [Chloroflexota bacterium]